MNAVPKPAKVTKPHSDASALAVTYRPVSALHPSPSNPRRHSPAQIGKIARSINAFGFNVPVLVDADDRVIAGHGRLLAALELKLERIPTIALGHLTDDQARAFVIADNRLTEIAEWDTDRLSEQFALLTSADLDFSLEATGFELPEIDLILQGEASVGLDPDDAPIEAGAPVTRRGDVWILGDHRIACGSALDPMVYAALMGTASATAVFTDPPYNVRIDGHVSGLGQRRHREFVQGAGEMSCDGFTDFLREAFRLMARHSLDGALHYVCMDWRHVRELLDAAADVYTETKNCCVWDKGNAGMGSLYRSQHELVWVFKAGQGRHTNNVQLGRFGRNRSNVWSYPGLNAFGRQTDEGNLLDLHPTVKPVALIVDALLDASARGDSVLDPFLGSGTTIIAAERTGRVGYGIELDPVYVDVAVRRWQRMTQRAAVHAVHRCTFDELTEEREVSRD